jgi:hypothetical protein
LPLFKCNWERRGKVKKTSIKNFYNILFFLIFVKYSFPFERFHPELIPKPRSQHSGMVKYPTPMTGAGPELLCL